MNFLNKLKSAFKKTPPSKACNTCDKTPPGCLGFFSEDKDCEWARQSTAAKLPDGSALFLMSFPLPPDHWLTQPRVYATESSFDTVDKPTPILWRAIHEHNVRAAAKWAIRVSTDCGREMDFDPDALVMNFVYAICGPATHGELKEHEPQHTSQE